MSQRVYVSSRTNKAIIALDTGTVSSDSESAQVLIQQNAAEVASELDLLQQTHVGGETVEVDANRSNQAIPLDLTAVNIAIGEINGVDRFSSSSEEAEIITIPNSYFEPAELPKWSRLCWEQQKASYGAAPFWTDMFGFSSTNETPGWHDGYFDFPIRHETLAESLTATSVYVNNYKAHAKINTFQANKSIDHIQTLWKPTGNPNWKWEHLQRTEQEDDPEDWYQPGPFSISSYAMIDDKQVPHMPLLPYGMMPKQYKSEFFLSPINNSMPKFIPYWTINDQGENELYLYYYKTMNEVCDKVRITKPDGTFVATKTFVSTENNEGTFSLGVFPNSYKPYKFHIQLLHTDRNGAKSWIQGYDIKTAMPIVQDTQIKIASVEKANINHFVNQNLGDFFIINISKENFSKLYIPESTETGWDVKIEDGKYREGILNEKLVVRLHVTKRFRGQERFLGSFIFNPTGAGYGDYSGITNLDSVFQWDEYTDGQDPNTLSFGFFPKTGAMQFNSDEDGEETYEFRISEWSLGVEYGLQTGENFAWMVGSPPNRYRYDTWDEQHPTRKWKRMNPVDPQYDSPNRLSEIAKSRQCVLYKSEMSLGAVLPEEPVHGAILSSNGWNVVYTEDKHRDYFGKWPHFDFSFQLSDKYKNAYNIKLVAEYTYYVQKEVPYTSTGSGGGGGGHSLSQQYTQYTWELAQISSLESRNLSDPPQSFPILQWEHWSPEFHVVDFVSYQQVFFIIWNYMMSTGKLQPPPEEVESSGGSTGGGAVGMLPSYSAPSTEWLLSKENFHQFEQDCLLLSMKVDDFITGVSNIYLRDDHPLPGVKIQYWAEITMPDGNAPNGVSVERILVNNLSEDFWENPHYRIGIDFDFDKIEQPADNLTWIPSGTAIVTGHLDTFHHTAAPDDGTSTTSPPGLKPATGYIPTDLNFNIEEIDMSGYPPPVLKPVVI